MLIYLEPTLFANLTPYLLSGTDRVPGVQQLTEDPMRGGGNHD